MVEISSYSASLALIKFQDWSLRDLLLFSHEQAVLVSVMVRLFYWRHEKGMRKTLLLETRAQLLLSLAKVLCFLLVAEPQMIHRGTAKRWYLHRVLWDMRNVFNLGNKTLVMTDKRACMYSRWRHDLSFPSPQANLILTPEGEMLEQIFIEMKLWVSKSFSEW